MAYTQNIFNKSENQFGVNNFYWNCSSAQKLHTFLGKITC